jgi:hypothetical protein
MSGIFAGDDLGQQAGAGQSLVADGDRHGSRGDMVMTLGASVLETDVLAHQQTGRDVVELLADVFAEFLADGVAAGAQPCRFGRRVLHTLAGQILGQRLAAMPLAWGLFGDDARVGRTVGSYRRG